MVDVQCALLPVRLFVDHERFEPHSAKSKPVSWVVLLLRGASVREESADSLKNMYRPL